VLAIPVDQCTSGLALTDEKRVTAEMWNSFLSFLRRAAFGINLPRIHPFEVIAAITGRVSCSKNSCLVGPTMNDRNAELSARTLVHHDRNVGLCRRHLGRRADRMDLRVTRARNPWQATRSLWLAL
jgi:hypothetical protein